jgi:hypothetical protein
MLSAGRFALASAKLARSAGGHFPIWGRVAFNPSSQGQAVIIGVLSIASILRAPIAPGDLSGFGWQFVGFVVGFFGQPDKGLPLTTNHLAPVCRVCRVYLGRESLQEFTLIKHECLGIGATA